MIRNSSLQRLLLVALVCLFISNSYAQVTSINTALAPSSFNNNNGSGLVTFNFENTNPFPVEIIEVSTVLRSAGSSTFTIYYNTTPVAGPPGVIPGSPNWTVGATNTINSTLGAAANQTQEVVLPNINVVIPANTTYGVAIGGFNGATGTMAYFTIPATPPTYTLNGGGCNLIFGNNVSYGFTSPTVTTANHPRGFVGTIKYQPQVTIQDNAGASALVSPNANDTFCSNSFKDIYVSIKNRGANALDSVKVGWSVNGVPQPPFNYTSQLPSYMDSAVVHLGQAFFPTTAPVQIKAWTFMPNGVVDADFTDDTLNASAAAIIEGVMLNITPGDTFICSNQSVVLDGGTHNHNPIYIWSNATLTQTMTVSTPGSYWLRVQNTQGCVAYDTVNIDQFPDPVVNSIPIIDNGNGSFTFNVLGAANVDAHRWDFGDGNFDPTWIAGYPTAQTKTYNASGEYNVTLHLRNKCKDITVIRKVTATTGLSVNDLNELKNAFRVYPNPAKNFVTIENDLGVKVMDINITNILGQKVFGLEALNSADKIRVDVSTLSAGIYSFVLITDKGQLVKKVEILK